VDVVIIGGGATGVELAAELREASGVYAAYGFRQLQAERDVRITLLEGAPRILAPLPEKVAAAALELLRQRAVTVVTDTRVTAIDQDGVTAGATAIRPSWWCGRPASRRRISCKRWACRPSSPASWTWTARWPSRATTIFTRSAIAPPAPAGRQAGAAARQAAHQQADYLLELSCASAAAAAPSPYRYRDYGSLVSFGQTTSVGSLMGSLKGLSWFVDGLVARMMYASLHLMHHRAVLGTVRTAALALARFLIKRSTPLVKLH
jgi:NADH dehydrogenase